MRLRKREIERESDVLPEQVKEVRLSVPQSPGQVAADSCGSDSLLMVLRYYGRDFSAKQAYEGMVAVRPPGTDGSAGLNLLSLLEHLTIGETPLGAKLYTSPFDLVMGNLERLHKIPGHPVFELSQQFSDINAFLGQIIQRPDLKDCHDAAAGYLAELERLSDKYVIRSSLNVCLDVILPEITEAVDCGVPVMLAIKKHWQVLTGYDYTGKGIVQLHLNDPGGGTDIFPSWGYDGKSYETVSRIKDEVIPSALIVYPKNEKLIMNI